MPSSPRSITQLLEAWSAGQRDAGEQVLHALYDELRLIAERYMRRERVNHTLQATEVVNQACLELAARENLSFKNRKHFIGFLSAAMHHYLVDYARQHKRLKRGGPHRRRVPLENANLGFEEQIDEILDVDRALQKLAGIDDRLVQIVELRYYSGRTFEEAAEVLEVSTITAKRYWRTAKAFLLHELNGEGKDEH